MNIENAKTIQETMNVLDELKRELDDFENNFVLISGHLCAPEAGVNFRWEKDDRHYKYILCGLRAEIHMIEEQIRKINYVE
jgi:hypothetical protein